MRIKAHHVFFKGSGRLSEPELRSALVNSDFTAFDPQTIRMMIRYALYVCSSSCKRLTTFSMFDADRSGTINFDEFWSVISRHAPDLCPCADQLALLSNLWGFLASWRALFDKFDEDGSGNISYEEFSNALVGKAPCQAPDRIVPVVFSLQGC